MKASYKKPLLPLRDIVIFPSMVVLFLLEEKINKGLTRGDESRQVNSFSYAKKF